MRVSYGFGYWYSRYATETLVCFGDYETVYHGTPHRGSGIVATVG